MINSILKLTGVEAIPVYLDRIDDVNEKGAWQGGPGDNNYIVSAPSVTYKTTSADASPAGLQEDLYWYDTGETENGEAVYYDIGETYAYWNDGSDWLISAVADVGGSPTDYFSFQDYPDTITVSGTGTSIDAVLAFEEKSNGAPQYGVTANGLGEVWKLGDDTWIAIEDTNGEEWTSPPTDYLPPKTGWSVGNQGSPAPTIAYTIPTDQFVGQGEWSGAITIEASPDIWQIKGLYDAIIEDSGTWPPEDFGDGVTTDIGQFITLDLQKGTGETYAYSFDGTYGTLPVITRYAYIFGGWYTAPEGEGTRVYDDDNLVVAEDDDTLYVRWIPTISGKVSSGQSMLEHFAISVGTDIFAAPLTARKTRPSSLNPVLPIPPGEADG